MQSMRLDRVFYAQLLLIGIATFAVHEFAHWIIGTALGYDMHFGLNQVGSSQTFTPLHGLLITGAGPLVTVLQALAGFAWVRRDASRIGFATLYMAFFMRLLAAGISVFNPNDEARMSLQLGLGMWTLPLLVVAGLFVLVFLASRRLRLGFREQFLCYVVASIAVTLMVGADRLFFHHG